MLGKAFNLGKRADFHARRGIGWVVLLRSSCPSLHTCPAPTCHHCSLLPAGQRAPHQQTHTTLPGDRDKQGARKEHRAHPSALCPSSHCSCGVDVTGPLLAHIPGKMSQRPAGGSWASSAQGQVMAHVATFHLDKGLLSTKGNKKRQLL